MFIVHVAVSVKPEQLEAFQQATLINAEASRKEPGIARFDVVQSQTEPTQFMLLEVYRDEHAPVKHKQTAHYQLWRDTIEPMMAAPRSSVKYRNLSPNDDGWD